MDDASIQTLQHRQKLWGQCESLKATVKNKQQKKPNHKLTVSGSVSLTGALCDVSFSHSAKQAVESPSGNLKVLEVASTFSVSH